MPSPHAHIQRNDYKKEELPEKAQKSLSVALSKMFVFQPRLNLISLIWVSPFFFLLVSVSAVLFSQKSFRLNFKLFPSLSDKWVSRQSKRRNHPDVFNPPHHHSPNIFVVTHVRSSGRSEAGLHHTGVPQGCWGLSPATQPLCSGVCQFFLTALSCYETNYFLNAVRRNASPPSEQN